MKEKKTGLEDFVERHRADFDAFEPRPDLWEAIERELSTPVAATTEEAEEVAPLRIVKLQPLAEEQPAAPAVAKFRRFAYGMAAAVAVLLLAGLGVLWTKPTASTGWTRVASAPGVAQQEAPGEDELSAAPFEAAAVGTAAASPQKRLAVAVQRMEAYYAAQITEKKQEISQVGRTGTAPAADWHRELATLDSTYNQLKVELYRNPEPDVVLEAMNRNMQIRLDILNQQLRLQERIKEYNAGGTASAENQQP